MHAAGDSSASQTAPGGEAASKAPADGAMASKQASEYNLRAV